MTSFLEEVSLGLSKKNKKLSSKWFYDFRGSKLFEQITKLKTYYPTRTERKILKDNNNKFECFIANDNTIGQIVVSGKVVSLEALGNELKNKNIKFIKLPVSAPFHCPLMKKATHEMKDEIHNTNFKDPVVEIISNVTATSQNNSHKIKELLIDQIEKPVKWRESVNNMISLGVNRFIEVGPGKVLSGLIKRIDRNVKINQVNNLTDIKNLNND